MMRPHNECVDGGPGRLTREIGVVVKDFWNDLRIHFR